MKHVANISLKALVVALSFGAGISAYADYPSTVLADHPSGYWRLETPYQPAAQGGVATNLGSFGATEDGVISAGAVTGQPGSIVGDSSTSINTTLGDIVISDTNVSLLSPFSLEAWVYKTRSAPAGSYQTILDGSGGNNANFRIYNGGATNDDVEFWTWSGASWVSVNLAAGTLPVDQWVYLVCSLDATGDMTVYDNGVLASNWPAANTTYSTAPEPFTIGYGIANTNLQGNIDDVAVYSNVLTASEVLAHYKAGTNGLGTYVATVQSNSPAGFWRLNESVPSDLALNVVNPDLYGVYMTNPKHQIAGALAASTNSPNWATAFDANDNLMQVPYSPALNPSVFTAEAWLEPTAYDNPGDAEGCALSSVNTFTTNDTPEQGWVIFQNSSGFECSLYNNKTNGLPSVHITGGPAVKPYQWYHVALSWDGSVASLYVDGALVGASVPTNFVPNASAAFMVGGRSDGSFFWGGVAQSVALYKTPLSGAQILNHYQNGTNASAAQSYASLIQADGAISYWPLGEGNFNTNVYEPNLGTIGHLGDGRFLFPMTIDMNNPGGPVVTESNSAATIFTGANSVISIPLNDVFNRTNAWSLEGWRYDETGDTGYTVVIYNQDALIQNGNGSDTRGYIWWINSNPTSDSLQISSIANTWNYTSENSIYNSLYTPSEWQHVVMTFDGTNYLTYENGVLANRQQFYPISDQRLVDRGVETIGSGNTFYENATGDSGGSPFVGELAEIALYTNALSADRVLAHYMAATGSNAPAELADFLSAPAGVSADVGYNITVPTDYLGTPPFTNQWWMASTNGVAISSVAGQTNSALDLTSVTVAEGGDYVLVVSDSAGSVTSAVVSVTVRNAPASVTSSPQSLTRAQGLTVSFDVTAAGSLPVFYQWLSNGVAITGATTSALTLSDIQPSYAASYSVAVSNAIGTNISSPATLTVVPGAPGSYAGAVVADGPIAYWPLDDPPGSTNALDIVGSYDGAYSGLEVLGQPGPFPGDTNESAVYFPGAGGIQIPYAAALNPPETFSVECWAEAATNGSGTARVLFSSRTYNPNGSGEGPWFAGYQLLAETNNAWEFTIGQQQLQPVSTLSVDSVVTNAADGAWHYIVGTYDNVTLNLNLYVDGQLVATVAATSDLNWWPNAVDGNFNQTAADEAIGSTSDDDPELAEGNQFYGKVDEMAVYGYALSPTQVASHFARSGNGPAELSIAKFSGQIVVTWSKGQLLEATSLLGPWTTNAAATSPLTNSPGGKTMFYRAVVTNAP